MRIDRVGVQAHGFTVSAHRLRQLLLRQQDHARVAIRTGVGRIDVPCFGELHERVGHLSLQAQRGGQLGPADRSTARRRRAPGGTFLGSLHLLRFNQDVANQVVQFRRIWRERQCPDGELSGPLEAARTNRSSARSGGFGARQRGVDLRDDVRHVERPGDLQLLLQKAGRLVARRSGAAFGPLVELIVQPLHSSPGVHQLKGDVLIPANGEDHAGCALRIQPGDDGDSAVRGLGRRFDDVHENGGERLQVTWRQLERLDVSAFPEMRSGALQRSPPGVSEREPPGRLRRISGARSGPAGHAQLQRIGLRPRHVEHRQEEHRGNDRGWFGHGGLGRVARILPGWRHR